MKILLTGGAGYIGSHTCVELLNAGYDVVVADDLSNAKKSVIGEIEKITKKKVSFYEIDVKDKEALDELFDKEKIDAVIHFAGFKAVGESVKKPLKYYRNNLDSTLSLLEVMEKHNCKNFIFSSSATVYGAQDVPKYVETMKKQVPSNPYGKTKEMIEEILEDMYTSDNSWNITLLRYFNPVGAHESGLIGDDPKGIPNNLMPYINYVACGKLDHLNVFGNDYNTPDGTGVRDYIHVVDLAIGHLKAIDKVRNSKGVMAYNLGTGIGYSVLDIVKAFENANDIKIKYEIAPRRAGDIAICYADPTKAKEELGWQATKNLEQMCKDSWRYTKNNI